MVGNFCGLCRLPKFMNNLNLYNPHNQSENELINGFVVRQEIFNRLFKSIKKSKMENPEQHILIEGQRGMGKTSLWLRLAYEVENDEELNTWLIPIIFKEEAYHQINCLFKLWEEIIIILSYKEDSFIEFNSIKDKYHSFDNEDIYERYCSELLFKQLKKGQ